MVQGFFFWRGEVGVFTGGCWILWGAERGELCGETWWMVYSRWFLDTTIAIAGNFPLFAALFFNRDGGWGKEGLTRIFTDDTD